MGLVPTETSDTQSSRTQTAVPQQQQARFIGLDRFVERMGERNEPFEK